VLAMQTPLQATGTFWAIAITESVIAVVAILLFRRGTWKQVKI
jgi:Na+-driven multidrug efflux pump